MAKYQRLIKIMVVGISGLFLMVAWMGGCTQKKGLKDVQDPFYEQWRVKAEEAKGTSPVEPPPIDEKPFEIASQEGEEEVKPMAPKPLPTRKISLKMNDIDVAVLLRALARAADQNIILNEKVSGKVNINIHEAPWDQVFNGILKTHGLSYSWEGEILRIMTAEDLATWCHALFEGEVVSQQSMGEMLQFVDHGFLLKKEGYGLGVQRFMRKMGSGQTAIGHSGGGIGSGAHMVHLPEHNVSVVVMVNTPWRSQRITKDLIACVLRDLGVLGRLPYVDPFLIQWFLLCVTVIVTVNIVIRWRRKVRASKSKEV